LPKQPRESQPNAIDWEEVARRIGYADAATMWTTLYVDQQLSVAALKERFGVSSGAIRTALRICHVPMRPKGGPHNHHALKIHVPPEEVEKAIAGGETIASVARRLGVSKTGLQTFRKRHRPPG
jgi:hypothetical protein